MIACSNQRSTVIHFNVRIQPSPAQVLASSSAAFLLTLFFFGVVWLQWESLFKAHPLLAIPFMASMVFGPASLFISLRRVTEVGWQKRLVFSAILSAAAVGLSVLTFALSLRHLAGGG